MPEISAGDTAWVLMSAALVMLNATEELALEALASRLGRLLS